MQFLHTGAYLLLHAMKDELEADDVVLFSLLFHKSREN
jgi:hypothetical protein